MSDRMHPEDLTPLVAGRREHTEYGVLRAHVDGCTECRSEVEELRQLSVLFRAQELEIEVPAHQWTRIAARLESERRTPLARLASWLWPAASPHRSAYSIAMLAIFAVVISAGGLYYRAYSEHQQILSALRASASETRRAENPFEAYLRADSAQNPFEKATDGSSTNPFAVAVAKQ
jgi:anti-sigma factor RsiW